MNRQIVGHVYKHEWSDVSTHTVHSSAVEYNKVHHIVDG
jgi:hypothetical protein